MRAAYAIYDHAIRLFGDRKAVDFGGGVGLEDIPDDGLAGFKKGFSNRTETCFLCGKILDRNVYHELSLAHRDESFFPGYRASR